MRSGQRTQPPHLTRFIQVPIRKLGANSCLTFNGCESRGRQGNTQWTGTAMVQLVLVTDTGGIALTQTCSCRVNFQSPWARTITYCPPPQPPHSGMDFTAAQPGWPIKTQNHHLHPFFRFHNPVSFSSSASSPPPVSVALCLFF